MRMLVAVLCAVCLSLAAGASAQDYPSKPVRILVPFAPGGAVDTTARILTSKMTERLNWQFVVENRPGGNGFIATTAAAKAAPDGYTLLVAPNDVMTVTPNLFPNGPYDPVNDFEPVATLGAVPIVLVVNASSSFKSVPDLIAAAKSGPRPLTSTTRFSPCSGGATRKRCSTR